MREQRLDDIVHQAEASEGKECLPCKVAAGLGITKNICDEFKDELDCSELATILDNPESHTLAEVEKAIERIAESGQGRPRELLQYTLCLMQDRCSLEDMPPNLRQ